MTSKLKAAQQSRALAETQLATVRATVEAAALERSRALLEAPQPVQVPWSEHPAFDDWGMGHGYRPPYVWTGPDDRTEGRYRPLYENESDVRRMRAEARSLVELLPIAKGALQKLSDYVMGGGWEFVVQPKGRYKRDPLALQMAAALQVTVDAFLEYNNFTGNLDREIHEQSRIDGNVFATLYPEQHHVRIELTDPGCVLQPRDSGPLERMLRTSHKLNGWWHGVHTTFNAQLKRDDVGRPLGYHAVFDRTGEMWDYLPASRVEHIKRNVCSQGRVGVSDFVTTLDDFYNEAKVRRNTAVGAAILSAIVMIRQHAEGASRSSIEGMVTESATRAYQKPVQGGSRSTNVEDVRPGTIKDTPAGMTTTLGALGTLRSPVYIEVAQYLLRIIGAPWSMPEYLISGDASNANYASSLVSESPFVKYCEHEQVFYGGHFERLIWKALAIYAKNGAFPYPWTELCARLQVSGEYTSPASRDKLQQSQANQLLNDAGVMSKRTWAADMGLDYDEERQQIALEPKPEPEPQPMGFGSPFGVGPMGRSPRLEALAERALARLLEARGA